MNKKNKILITIFGFILMATLVLANTTVIRDTVSDFFGINNTGDFITIDPYIDVRAYGANGTDNLSDMFAFDAILSANIQNFSIFIPCGTFIFNDDWDFTGSHKNIEVFGLGECSVITLNNSANTNIIELSGSDFITLRDFKIDGNSANQASGGKGITSTSGANDITIRNMHIIDTRSEGIFLNLGSGRFIENNLIENGANDDGIELFKPTDYTIIGNVINNPFDNGILIQGTPNDNGIISNNIIKHVITDEKAGIFVTGGSKVVISNNVIFDGANTSLGTNGILSRNNYSTIIGNIIYNVTGAGIEVQGTVIVSGNSILKVSSSDASSSGISINSGRDIVITNNYIEGTSLNGIKMSASGNLTNVIVSNNIVKNSGNAAIFIQAASNVIVDGITITNNRLYDDQTVPTQDYGIRDGNGGGTVFNVIISGNFYRGNVIANVSQLVSSETIPYRFDTNISFVNSSGYEYNCGINDAGQFSCT